jgi:glycosyl-4,4'-diaponeurosporenoate acyltransferase
MIVLKWVANVLGWPVIHMVIAYVALQWPQGCLERDSWITAPRRWERKGHLYRDCLAIRRWKRLLPDGAPWLSGFSKKNLRARDPIYVARFLVETRRAEIAHWCMLACLPVFFLWNPLWARWVMTGYAFAANLPCIVVQRYNRFALDRMVRSRYRVQVHQ